MALAWGAPPPNAAPFDLVLGTDLFYAREAMGLLVSSSSRGRLARNKVLLLLRIAYYLSLTTHRFLEQVDTLVSLSGPRTVVWLAAGRNRQAADEFWPLAEVCFAAEP